MSLDGCSVGSWQTYNPAAVRNGISNGAVLISGTSGSFSPSFTPDKNGGHSWMADGFIYKYEKVDVYHYPSNSLVGEFVETYYDTIESVHFNWGWMGKGNGFYSGNIFRVEKSDTTVALFNETKFLTISAQ